MKESDHYIIKAAAHYKGFPYIVEAGAIHKGIHYIIKAGANYKGIPYIIEAGANHKRLSDIIKGRADHKGILCIIEAGVIYEGVRPCSKVPPLTMARLRDARSTFRDARSMVSDRPPDYIDGDSWYLAQPLNLAGRAVHKLMKTPRKVKSDTSNLLLNTALTNRNMTRELNEIFLRDARAEFWHNPRYAGQYLVPMTI